MALEFSKLVVDGDTFEVADKTARDSIGGFDSKLSELEDEVISLSDTVGDSTELPLPHNTVIDNINSVKDLADDAKAEAEALLTKLVPASKIYTDDNHDFILMGDWFIYKGELRVATTSIYANVPITNDNSKISVLSALMSQLSNYSYNEKMIGTLASRDPIYRIVRETVSGSTLPAGVHYDNWSFFDGKKIEVLSLTGVLQYTDNEGVTQYLVSTAMNGTQVAFGLVNCFSDSIAGGFTVIYRTSALPANTKIRWILEYMIKE